MLQAKTFYNTAVSNCKKMSLGDDLDNLDKRKT